MAYYNDIFLENNRGRVNWIGSCYGSDAPDYFQNIKKYEDISKAFDALDIDGCYPSRRDFGDDYPFVWKHFTASDNLIVIRPTRKYWWEFWKRDYSVWLNIEKKYDSNLALFYDYSKHDWLSEEDIDLNGKSKKSGKEVEFEWLYLENLPKEYENKKR